MDRNNSQPELIRYRKKCDFIHVFLCEVTDSMQYRRKTGHHNLHWQCWPIRQIAEGDHATHIRQFRTKPVRSLSFLNGKSGL